MWGGVLLHDLGMRFDTPTINLTVDSFPQFVSEYTTLYQTETKPYTLDVENQPSYPVLRIGDNIIKAIHYKSVDEFNEKWNKRFDRFMSSDAEIFIIACDAQVKTDKDKKEFLKLPYRKVCFTNKHYDEKEFIYIPGYDNLESVGDLTKYCDLLGHRVFEKYFDCVSWLNSGEYKQW